MVTLLNEETKSEEPAKLTEETKSNTSAKKTNISRCRHCKRKDYCIDCGGRHWQTCPHGKLKDHCRDCGAGTFCSLNLNTADARLDALTVEETRYANMAG